MPAPLTNLQKRKLACLCRRAFAAESAKARARGVEWDQSEDQFRHAQVARATGKLGLRCCTQLDYKAVEAVFLDLLGESDRAFESAVQAQTEPRRQAEAVLWRNLQHYGLRPEYAEAICRRQFKCGVLEASTGQLWKLIYTVRNRGGARRRATKGNQCATSTTTSQPA